MEQQKPMIPREEYLRLVDLAQNFYREAQQNANPSPEDFVSALVDQAAVALAENSRQRRRRLQAEGIARAKQDGVRFGRPMAQPKGDFPQLVAQWQAGQISFRQALDASGLSESTFYRRLRQLRQAQ